MGQSALYMLTAWISRLYHSAPIHRFALYFNRKQSQGAAPLPNWHTLTEGNRAFCAVSGYKILDGKAVALCSVYLDPHR